MNERTDKDIGQRTDKDIEHAYVLARHAAENVAKTITIAHVDIDDMTQDAMEGWLKGQNMGHAIIDALRDQRGHFPDNRAYHKGASVPEIVPYFNTLEGGEVVEEKFVDPTLAIENKTALSQALQCIEDPRARRIIWLYFFEDKNTREIAEMLKLSKSRVDQLKHDALNTLKENLA